VASLSGQLLASPPRPALGQLYVGYKGGRQRWGREKTQRRSVSQQRARLDHRLMNDEGGAGVDPHDYWRDIAVIIIIIVIFIVV